MASEHYYTGALEGFEEEVGALRAAFERFGTGRIAQWREARDDIARLRALLVRARDGLREEIDLWDGKCSGGWEDDLGCFSERRGFDLDRSDSCTVCRFAALLADIEKEVNGG